MSAFLTLAYLFFLGSLFGWVLELFFRKFFSRANPEHRWINPGFCVGPYVPHIHGVRERMELRQRFFFPLHTTVRPLTEHLREAHDALEHLREKHGV